MFLIFRRMPVVGDIIGDEYCSYEVLATQGARIVRIKAIKKPFELESEEK